MIDLRETERRNPELIVAAAFLWAPCILTIALWIDDPDVIVWALLLAGIPYVGVILWPFYVSIREAKGPEKAFVIAATIAFFVLAFVLSSLGFPAD